MLEIKKLIPDWKKGIKKPVLMWEKISVEILREKLKKDIDTTADLGTLFFLEKELTKINSKDSSESMSIENNLYDSKVISNMFLEKSVYDLEKWDEIDFKYKILKQIWKWEYWVVYKVKHLKLDRISVLKFFVTPNEINSDQYKTKKDIVSVFKKEFHKEAKVAASIKNKKNLVEIFDVKVDEPNTYIEYSYCDSTLEKYLDENCDKDWKLEVEKVLTVILQICSWLTKIHKSWLMHRDIKIQNIFLNNWQIKIWDFWLACPSFKRNFKQAVWSVPYMNESALDGSPNRQSDIYAVLVIFYELLTWHLPKNYKKVNSDEELLDIAYNEDIIDIKTFNKNIPNELCEIIMDWLNIECYKKIEDLHYAIDAFYKEFLEKKDCTKTRLFKIREMLSWTSWSEKDNFKENLKLL